MLRVWHRYSRIVDVTSGWPSVVSGILIIPMAGVVVYTALVRTLTPFSPDWGFLVGLFLYGTAIMLAGGEVLRRDEHVAVDILPTILPRKAGDLLRIFSMLLIVFVAAVLVYFGSVVAWESTLIDEHSSHPTNFDPPIWWFRWVIPISAFLILLEGIRRLGGLLRGYGKTTADDLPSGQAPRIDDEKGASA